MRGFSSMTGHSTVAGKHVQVRALETPGNITITRVVPGVVGRESGSIRKKQVFIRLDRKRVLKDLAYRGVPLVEESDRVVIISAGGQSQIASGRNFNLSLREIAASAVRGGFGGSSAGFTLPGTPPRLPPIHLKCPRAQCVYRVAVYYYDPDTPPPCAVHPDSKMVPA